MVSCIIAESSRPDSMIESLGKDVGIRVCTNPEGARETESILDDDTVKVVWITMGFGAMMVPVCP